MAYGIHQSRRQASQERYVPKQYAQHPEPFKALIDVVMLPWDFLAYPGRAMWFPYAIPFYVARIAVGPTETSANAEGRNCDEFVDWPLSTQVSPATFVYCLPPTWMTWSLLWSMAVA